MAHEITSQDNLVLREKGAWHGLGVIFEGDKTPREICDEVFPYEVGSRHLYIKDNDGKLGIVEGHRMNVRTDTGDHLGLVSDKYKIIQPWEMADFAEALVEDGDTKVKVETAGSIQGGKRLWFLLRGEEFNVRDSDTIFPYVLLSNGYDGTSAFRVTPTTVRAVCANTLFQSIPRNDSGEKLHSSAIVVRHTVNAMSRIKEAKKALAGYSRSTEETKKVYAVLSTADINSEAVKQFFLESYTTDFGAIPENPQDGWEQSRRDRALSALSSFSRRFDDERGIAGATYWNALNAYTGMVQHDQKSRGANDIARLENRTESNLFGLNAERSSAALQRAYRSALQVS